jgi:hypothetical protein
MLTCSHCGGDRLRLSRQSPDSLDGAELYCGGCAEFVRLVRPPGAPPPRLAPAGPDATPADQEVSPVFWWVGLVCTADGEWLPVALSATLSGCWEALLDYPGRLDRLAIPTAPPWPRLAASRRGGRPGA